MEFRSKSAYQKRKQSQQLQIDTEIAKHTKEKQPLRPYSQLEIQKIKEGYHHKTDQLPKNKAFTDRQFQHEKSRSAIRELEELYTPSNVHGRTNWWNNEVSNNLINKVPNYDKKDKVDEKEEKIGVKQRGQQLQKRIEEQIQKNHKLSQLYETQKQKYERQKQKNAQLSLLLKNLQQINSKAERQSKMMVDYKNIKTKEQESQKVKELEVQLKKQLIINLQLEECMTKFIERKQNDKQNIQRLMSKIKTMENKYMEYIINLKEQFAQKKRVGQLQIQTLLKKIQVKDNQFQKLKEFAYVSQFPQPQVVKNVERKSGFFNRFVKFSKELDLKCDINGYSTLNSMIGVSIAKEDEPNGKRSGSVKLVSARQGTNSLIKTTALQVSQINDIKNLLN